MKSLTYIDLFAGAGGLSEGFIRAGYTPIAHVEMDLAACYTLKTRIAYHHLKETGNTGPYEDYLKGKINRSTLYSHIPEEKLKSVINLAIGPENNEIIHKQIRNQLKGRKVDLIIGGPPCQAYSLVGRARSKNGMVGDPRNYLYKQYAEYLNKYKPSLFVFENVIGLKSANKGQYLEEMKELFKETGYKTELFKLEANNFEVLQNRRRIILIGHRKSLKLSIPDLNSIKFENIYHVSDILTDLPELKDGSITQQNFDYKSKPSRYLSGTEIRTKKDILTQHITRPHTKQDKEIYKIAVKKWNSKEERLNYNDLPDHLKTHKNRHSFFDRFKVVAANKSYAQTVVAHIAKDGHYYIHPDISQNRSLSVREAARLQSFPDNYYFEGVKEKANRTAAYKQIGNAVPPVMAFRIAEKIKTVLK